MVGLCNGTAGVLQQRAELCAGLAATVQQVRSRAMHLHWRLRVTATGSLKKESISYCTCYCISVSIPAFFKLYRGYNYTVVAMFKLPILLPADCLPCPEFTVSSSSCLLHHYVPRKQCLSGKVASSRYTRWERERWAIDGVQRLRCSPCSA